MADKGYGFYSVGGGGHGVMDAHTFIPLFGKATHCECFTKHEPIPLRYVWHHILPVVCGGKSVTDNLVQVCDNCHYAIHAMLYDLRKNSKPVIFSRFRNTSRGKLAMQGYTLAVAAGTADKIPQEGSVE